MSDSISLLFKASPTRLDAITIEALVLSEAHSGESEMTDHPVERGINVTDHIQPKPLALKLEVLLYENGLSQKVAFAGGSAVTPATTGSLATSADPMALLGSPLPTPSRARELYAQLDRLRLQGQSITLTTRLRQYENLVINGLSAPVTVAEADALRVTITMREIRTVQSKTVPVRVRTPRAAKNSNGGPQPTKPADPATAAKAPVLQSKVIGVLKWTGALKG